MVMVGEKAPEFALDAVVGKGEFTRVSLADLRGKWVLLFFYPLDFTSVCPTELIELSRKHAEFQRLGTEVLGCSVDSKYAHRQWIGSTLGQLPFALLSDLTREVTDRYGALLRDKGHALRATFLIDPDGVIQYALYHDERVGRSIQETLRVLEALQTGDNCPVDWKRGDKTLGAI